jgi:Protein of unknown function (DUF3102)
MNTMQDIDQAEPPAAFEYSAFSSELADAARKIAERVRGRTQKAIFDNGRDLLGMRDKLEHGLFLKWVEAECGFGKSTAYNLMNAVERFGDKLPTVGSLPPATIYRLAAPSTPEPIREAVVSRSPTRVPCYAYHPSGRTRRGRSWLNLGRLRASAGGSRLHRSMIASGAFIAWMMVLYVL